MNAYLIFLVGLVVITIGSESLLRGASRIASLLDIHPIVIGLTVVSIGTSLPELFVGVTAIKDGSPDIVIGNIAGTNIVNILLILGLSAAIRALPLRLDLINVEVFTMIFAALLLFIMCLDGLFSFWDALILFTIGILYLIWVVKNSKKESQKVLDECKIEYKKTSRKEKKKVKNWVVNSVLLVMGIIITLWGADLLISGAVQIAKAWGVSDAVIGLTIIAIGTSAPELATTLVATFKNNRDVGIGNLLGSSVINILIILSTTTLFTHQGIQVDKDILWFDLLFAVLAALLCYPVFKSGQKMSRLEGVVFVLLYFAYMLFLFLGRV